MTIAIADGASSDRHWQTDFVRALLDPDLPIPPGVVGPDGQPSPRRFNVYRNNVVAGLIATLKDAFPVVERLVGGAFFAGMARIYVAGEPPSSPMMFDYGASFPDFMGGFPPAAGLPYLRDVARIERAWVEAYHAAEARPLTPAAFAGIAADDLPHLHVALHPSLRLVRSRYPSLTIWQMNIAGGSPASVDLDGGGDDILVVRPGAEVEVRSLAAGCARFLQALDQGRSILEATDDAMTADRRFDLAGTLAGLMYTGALVGVTSAPLPSRSSF